MAGQGGILMGRRGTCAGQRVRCMCAATHLGAITAHFLPAAQHRFPAVLLLPALQYTVNNQMVNATLMNIADNPTNVQLPGVCE